MVVVVKEEKCKKQARGRKRNCYEVVVKEGESEANSPRRRENFKRFDGLRCR